jgi:hypothetical protein
MLRRLRAFLRTYRHVVVLVLTLLIECVRVAHDLMK